MTVVSLLRAINVGKRQAKKEDLIAVHEAAGCRSVRTYLASGNVLFGTDELNLTKLTTRIEAAFEQRMGFRSDVILRTGIELADALLRDPFSEHEPSRVLITFLTTAPTAAETDAAMAIPIGPEQMLISGRELFVHYPQGMGRSRFPDAKISKALGGKPGTARNVNTVRALSQLAKELPS